MCTLPNCNLAEDHVVSVGDDLDPLVYFDQWLSDVRSTMHVLNERLPDALIDCEHEIFLESKIGSNCDVTFEGVLHFDGYSISDVRSPLGTLVLTEKGRIEADIEVSTAIINGIVTGNITATERVVLESGARVRGLIQTPAFSMRVGALLDGDCVLVKPASVAIQAEVFELNDSLFSEVIAAEVPEAASEELEEFLLTA